VLPGLRRDELLAEPQAGAEQPSWWRVTDAINQDHGPWYPDHRSP
jgi:hypothetical protein